MSGGQAGFGDGLTRMLRDRDEGRMWDGDELVSHDRVTVRTAAGETWWCLKGAVYHIVSPLRRIRLCRIGWHEWCRCCSPVTCIRCGRHGHD